MLSGTVIAYWVIYCVKVLTVAPVVLTVV